MTKSGFEGGSTRTFLSWLRENNIHLKLEEGELSVSYPKGKIDENIINEIKIKKPEIISYLIKLNNNNQENIPVIKNNKKGYALSSAQKRLWILSKIDGGNEAYIIPGTYIFNGILNVKALESSFKLLIERHEILRTVFREDEDGEVKQVVKPSEDSGFKLSVLDISQAPDKEVQVRDIVKKIIVNPFNLIDGPLIRAVLIKLDSNKWVLTFTMHHIISDGWSMDVIIHEILTLYNSYLKGIENPLSPLRIQYKDYASWQQDLLRKEELKEQKNYWLNQFKDGVPLIELSTDFKRPIIKTYNGGLIIKRIDKILNNNVKSVSAKHSATFFMGLLAGVYALLYRYTKQEDIIIGSPIAGREHMDLEGQVGFYVNTLALRTKFNGDDNFIELLKKVRQTTLEAYEHQAYPFDELVEALNLQRDLSRNALFDVMVTLQNESRYDNHSGETGFKKFDVIEIGDSKEMISKFDLTFNFTDSVDKIETAIEYNRDLFNSKTINRIGDHLLQLLKALTENPTIPINQLDFLSGEEKTNLQINFNNTSKEYPTDKTILDLFFEQVESTPEKIALVFEKREFTYREMNEKSNQLGWHLRNKYNIQPGELIGIKLDRNEWMVISILSVIKSGGAYLPIDTEYPLERIEYILTDSKCKVLIDEFFISEFITGFHTISNKDFTHKLLPDNIFTVIYTTGSTGQPKGVILTNRNILNRLHWMWETYPFNKDETSCLKTSIGFGDHVWELFGPLLKGIKLILFTKNNLLDTEQFLDELEKWEISRIVLVPSLLKEILRHEIECKEKLTKLKYWSCSGETLPNTLAEHFCRVFPNHTLLNIYGTTEVTADATVYDFSTSDSSPGRTNKILIGKPIGNVQIYILDASNNLVPIGVEGEICVGGMGISRGYLNKAELTQEQFLINPYRENEYIYKTGDLGRWSENGIVEYIGRKDKQVKIRGYRIELREIENAIQSYPGIDTSIVISKSNSHNEMELIAYLVSKDTLNAHELREFLNKKIPHYMIPGRFVQLNNLPLTTSGKTDLHKLPDPAGISMPTGKVHIAPRNETEIILTGIWSSILGIETEKISMRDNFFELGGHSLNATRVVSQVHKQFELKVSLNDFFLNPTIEGIVNELNLMQWVKMSGNTKPDNSNIENIIF